ncbi:g2692 [Coccomyxa elongata]
MAVSSSACLTSCLTTSFVCAAAGDRGLETRAGIEHVPGKLVHKFKHGGVRNQIDLLGSADEQRRYAKHGCRVHKAKYANRMFYMKLSMAKVAGHRHGFVQLYRAGIWCSIERDTAFKGLFDRITLVSDAQLARAEALLSGRKEWPGVRATLIALRNYTDVFLQDLVEWVDHPVMGADYHAATGRFPFLLQKNWQHVNWVRFVKASHDKAATLRLMDLHAANQRIADFQAGQLGQQAPVTPETPQQLPPVQQLPPPMQQEWQLAPPVQEPPLAATIDLVQAVPNILTAPPYANWSAAALYARYNEPQKPGVPSLREVMVHQGHLNWARPGKDRKAVMWMQKFWSRIRCEVNAGKELQQALQDAQDEYDMWCVENRAKKAKLVDGEKCNVRSGFKAWVEDEGILVALGVFEKDVKQPVATA